VEIKKPEHQVQMDAEGIPGDKGGYFSNLKSTLNYLSNSQTSQAIQSDRVSAITNALNQDTFQNILDFGIGDGVRFRNLKLEYETLTGIDISKHMIRLCKKNLKMNGNNKVHNIYVGNQDTLENIPANTYDLVLLIHILGYIPESEYDQLFRNIYRILIDGGKLLISTGNKLFDLFALNSGTRDFFKSEFKVDNIDGLVLSANSNRFKNANRINPLSFNHFLRTFGFEEIKQTFSQFHHVPPQTLIQLGASIEEARIQSRSNHIDSNSFSDIEKWRQYFQCSVVVSLSVANKN
jgi:ubiquinone/menaquinone biosynthesis C-methylase UbiE